MRKLAMFLFVNIYTSTACAQSIAALYKEVNPSVVTILTESKVLKEDYQMATDEGLGSGVLISEEGRIL